MADYEPGGRRFESFRARQIPQIVNELRSQLLRLRCLLFDCAGFCAALGMLGEMLRREMRVAKHHLVAAPATKRHQYVEWRSTPHVTTRPGVTQIVPAKIRDFRSHERLAPRMVVRSGDGFPEVREYPSLVLSDLPMKLSLVVIRPPGLLSDIVQQLRRLLPPIYDQ